MRFTGDNHADVAASAATILEVGEPRASKNWHNIGTIGFFDDPEKSRWILVGEKQFTAHAQDTSTNLGSMLRIIPYRSARGYEPHPDNPFNMGAGASSGADIYAWGLRSPWRGSVDARGRVWIGDVGSMIEEVSLARGSGHNFGWGITEGPCDGPECDALTNPVVSWTRSSGHRYRMEDADAEGSIKRCAWVGAAHRAQQLDPYDGFLDDSVLFSDMCVGYVRALSADDDGTVTRDEHVGHLVGLSGAAQGPDGFMYVTSFGSCSSATRGYGGGIYRVVPRYDRDAIGPAVGNEGVRLTDDPLAPVPTLISEVGVFADQELTRSIDRVIEFEPAWPLWSNGGEKVRWLLLPEGTQVDTSDRERWEFPEGTIFLKTFTWPEAPGRVETPLMRKRGADWEFQVYLWRADGTDADLLPGQNSIVRTVSYAGAEVGHEVPSRFDCVTCHGSNRTAVIGFDELRLNTLRAGAQETQLQALAAAGVFSEPLPAVPDAVVHADATTQSVLGYLHGNCAHCHNDGPTTLSALDLHHRVALANLIGQPVVGSGQLAGMRVVPGSPADSVVLQAMARQSADPELQYMPPLGVQLVDSAAVSRVEAWIAGLSGGP